MMFRFFRSHVFLSPFSMDAPEPITQEQTTVSHPPDLEEDLDSPNERETLEEEIEERIDNGM